MRDWLWRAFACAGGAFAGCDAAWTFMPVDADRSFTEALLRSPPDADITDAPTQRRSRRRRGCNQAKMAKECEDFLAGRYHELLAGNHRQAPPGWAWINPLAHVDHAELKRLANLSSARDDPLAFLSYLADELLLRTSDDDDGALRRIQHDILVPLELALLHHASSHDFTEIARILRDLLDDRTSRADVRGVLDAISTQ